MGRRQTQSRGYVIANARSLPVLTRTTTGHPADHAGPQASQRVQPVPSEEAASDGRLVMDVTFPEYQ